MGEKAIDDWFAACKERIRATVPSYRQSWGGTAGIAPVSSDWSCLQQQRRKRSFGRTLADAPRADSQAVLSKLQDLGARVVMVTGDSPDTAAVVARQVDIGTSDRDFDSLFTANTPVISNFHGYAWLIHKFTYRRTNHSNMHVRGYKEKGNINTPLELAIRNQIDRFNIAIDVIDRVPRLRGTGVHLKE